MICKSYVALIWNPLNKLQGKGGPENRTKIKAMDLFRPFYLLRDVKAKQNIAA